jgi:anaerobic selenocysteine-containing dehydrogenase
MTDTSTHLRTACNRDCPDVCGILATVRDGRVTRLQGDPDHPVTRGFLCHRTSRFLDRQYSPDRLTTPLMRDGDGFRPIGWDEALDRIARQMCAIRAESGPGAILHYRSGGSLGLMKHVTDALFERFGPVTLKSGDICSGAGDAAQLADFGVEDSHDLEDLRNARTILLWGKNPHVSSPHLVPLLRECRKAGARVVLVDPVHHQGVSSADLYLQPRPGGDVALGLGVARELFEAGAVDPTCEAYCLNLQVFRRTALGRSTAHWAELAGVRVDEVRALAQAYAQGPSAILVGWGTQRRGNGSAAVRVLDALGAISGNLGVAGGGVSFYFQRRGAFDLSFASGAAARRLPEALLGQAVLEARDPPVRAVWVTAGNPVAMLPDSRKVAEALQTRDLTVVVDAFLTDTARCAHFVLPTTTLLEEDDLVGSYGHAWLAEVRPVVARPEGVRSDYEIAGELAVRLGLPNAQEFRQPVEVWKRRLLSRVADHGAGLDQLRQGPVRHPLAPKILFEDRKFPTPSGKVELVTDLDPTPPQVTPQRPMLLMALSTERSQASQPAGAQEPQGPPVATVHPDAALGFDDGGLAQVVSDVGAMTVRLRFDPRQRRDVLAMAKGGSLGAGRCPNALVPARQTDCGGGAVYYDTPVALLPVD